MKNYKSLRLTDIVFSVLIVFAFIAGLVSLCFFYTSPLIPFWPLWDETISLTMFSLPLLKLPSKPWTPRNSKLNPYFISGFAYGEASFSIGMSRANKRTGG